MAIIRTMQDFRPTLLHHMLELAPFEGWSHFAFREAVRLSGISDAEARQAFPNGAADTLSYYFEQVDEKVKAEFTTQKLAAMRVPERIESLIMARLAAMQPHREAVKRAASQTLLPWNMAGALHSLYSMTDWMWRLAGDQSTDYNFYTKRATLAGVYVPTFLAWAADPTPDLAVTRQILKNNLAGVANFGKKKKALIDKLNAFSYARNK